MAFAHTQDYNKQKKKKTKSTHPLCLGADATLERERNERDVLEALGDYKRDTGMPVENDVHGCKQKQKGDILTQVLYWVDGGGGEECGKEEECC